MKHQGLIMSGNWRLFSLLGLYCLLLTRAFSAQTTKIDFDVHIEYLSSPDINNREVILCDPMLASGSSMILALKALKTKGIPKHVHIVSVIASSKGLDYIRNNICINNYTVWIGAEDKEITKESYIVPGLGDAGDLAFGQKKDFRYVLEHYFAYF